MVLTAKGKSSKPNSFTTLASDVVDAESISCVPPRKADCICISLPSCEAGNSRTFSLPPLLAAGFGERLHAETHWMVGVVEITPADRALLQLGVCWDSNQRDRDGCNNDCADPHGCFLP